MQEQTRRALYLSPAPSRFLYRFFTARLYITILETGRGYPWGLHTVPQRLASCSSWLTEDLEGPAKDLLFSHVRELDLPRVKLKLRKNGQQKHANCHATMLKNELNSDVARFTTHIKPVLQQIRLLTGLNRGGTRRNIAFQLVLQQCCKKGCTF